MAKNTPAEENDQITLTLEDDSELVCDVDCIFPYGDKQYIALLPQGNKEFEDDIFLYGFVEKEDGEVELIDIDNDEEFDAVSEAYYSMLDDAEYDEMFDDEEDEEQ